MNANYDSNKIAIRALSRGIGTKLFNEQVLERYGNNQNLIDACLIQEWDTMPEITYKQLTYFFTLGNFSPIVEEKIYMRNKPRIQDDKPYVWMLLHLKFKERYHKNSEGVFVPIHQRRIKISNINMDTVDTDFIQKEFNDRTLVYGSRYVTYGFNNGKEIRLEHCESIKDAINLIKSALLFTRKETHQEGNLIDNILTVDKPKNTPKVNLHGLTGHIYKATFHTQEGNKTNLLSRIMIQNKARE